MKAVFASAGISPSRLVDLSHELRAHGVAEAAFLLREMARGFPAGTVHVAVVDPGVGGRRAPIVVETRSGTLLVGPDNGVLWPLADELGFSSAFRIDPARLGRRPRVGTTFDGRDIFAPAAALVARGTAPSKLGPRWSPARFSLPAAHRGPDGATGEVLHTDRFGNVITNIPSAWVGPGASHLAIRIGGGSVREVPFASSYEALGRGILGCLGSSFGLVEVAVGDGRASDRLRAAVGTPVELAWPRTPPPASAKAKSARPRKRR